MNLAPARRNAPGRGPRTAAWLLPCLASGLVALAGCASAPRDGMLSPWWNPIVLAVMPAGRLEADVDRRCLSGDAQTVAVVGFRVGRVPSYRKAFALPPGRALHPGDRVWVRPGTCELDSGVQADERPMAPRKAR